MGDVEATAMLNSADLPLAGVRVLDVTEGHSAIISRYFAELGADVIRIEPEGGSLDRRCGTFCAGISLEYVAANTGKRIALIDSLQELAEAADIVIADRNRVDPACLREKNPKLVVLSVSDFGDTGRFAGWIGSDAVFHALSGQLSRSGVPGRPPLLPPGQIAVNCAVAQAAFAALVAHWNALVTGRGDYLDFSMLDGAAQALDPGYGISGSAAGGILASKLPRGRMDVRYLYPILPCRDGLVRLCVLAPRQWQGLFEWMGKPEEFADPEFNKTAVRYASKTLLPAIARFIADKSCTEVEDESQHFGVPAAPMLRLEEVPDSPQMTARQVFQRIDLGNGLMAAFPRGMMDVDGRRMQADSAMPSLPEVGIDWKYRELAQTPGLAGARPFAGLRVLDFGVIVVGAETGRLFGDQGADVIKVESSQFKDGSRESRSTGPISPSFTTGHRNKRSLGIDVRNPKGREILLELIRDTDVLLSNFKGGTLESLGLDYATLSKINPRIVIVDSSAFGPTGPWARRMGYGPLVRASAGLSMQWRYPDDPMSFSDAITVYPDHVAARVGAFGALALLIRRLRTGRGGQLSVSQAEVMLAHLAPQFAARKLEQAGQQVIASPESSTVYASAGDDDWCVVTTSGAADEERIAAVTGGRAIGDWIAQLPSREAMERLQEGGVAAAAMLRVAELPTFPYFSERGFFRPMNHPHISERLTVEAVLVRAENLPSPPEGPAPVLAEHTTEILGERLGMSENEVRSLVTAKVLEQFSMQS